ncbi:hypothetical protein J4410_01315 [Candidatus Woesearchaeota archaeon]|nr:hypothetical protein [Candidatus Woesearchaeota archaeon]
MTDITQRHKKLRIILIIIGSIFIGIPFLLFIIIAVLLFGSTITDELTHDIKSTYFEEKTFEVTGEKPLYLNIGKRSGQGYLSVLNFANDALNQGSSYYDSKLLEKGTKIKIIKIKYENYFEGTHDTYHLKIHCLEKIPTTFITPTDACAKQDMNSCIFINKEYTQETNPAEFEDYECE